jgi:hypothetical protein
MIYVKLIAAWAALMGIDYIFGFRLEYLWPAWLLVRSIYDSFRYQGLVRRHCRRNVHTRALHCRHSARSSCVSQSLPI